MRINIKPADRHTIYETGDQAINHVFLFGVYAQHWEDSRPFGQKMADMRQVNDAIKARDFAAFKASKRKGYWRVELCD